MNQYFMGQPQVKNLKNYNLTFAPEPCPTAGVKNVAAYQKHLLPQQMEVPGYCIKSKSNLISAKMSQSIFIKPQYLTILTYNIWFESHNAENRYPCIIRMLADSKADFICLQEVNSQFLNLLHQSAAFFKQGYDYCMPIMKMHWYDTLILSRYPCKFYKQPFENSGMGRCCLTAIIQFAQQLTDQTLKLSINCVHLQSLNMSAARVEQIKEIEVLNKELDMTFIIGDFNFSDGWTEDKSISKYNDVWKTGKRHFSPWANQQMKEIGYTMPPTPKFPPWRPDHIIYSIKQNSKIPKNTQQQKKYQNEIGIIGDFTIPPYEQDHFSKLSADSAVRTPSDHFGLICKVYI